MSGALLMAASMPGSGSAGGGGGGTLVSISDHNIGKIGNGSSSFTVSITYNASGITTNHNNATLETWLVSGPNSDYEIRATYQAGSPVTTGTMDTWLALSSSRAWTLSIPINTEDSATFLIEIRLAASPNTVLDSASITLSGQNSTL